MNYLSLFSGVEGGGLAFQHLIQPKWRCIGYCEIDEYCQAVLAQRVEDGYLDPAPIFGDIRKFISEGYAEAYQGMVDVITAGFPCQKFSVAAGARRDPESDKNLWPETLLSIQIIKPQWIFLENVPGLLSSSHGYFGTILQGLAESGYNVRWDCISAAAIGANHLRDRIWIVANATSTDARSGTEIIESDKFIKRKSSQFLFDSGSRSRKTKTWNHHAKMADSDNKGLQTFGKQTRLQEEERKTRASIKRRGLLGKTGDTTWWDIEPRLGRVAHGVANRLDRLKAIGNGQVPRVVEVAWKVLSGEQ